MDFWYQESKHFMPIVVKANKGEGTDAVVKRFQRKVAMEKVIQEYRDRQFHITDAEKRQRRRAEKTRKIMRSKRLSDN